MSLQRSAEPRSSPGICRSDCQTDSGRRRFTSQNCACGTEYGHAPACAPIARYPYRFTTSHVAVYSALRWKFGHTRHSRADLGGDSRVTSHPLERQPISCYYYACDLSCFDVVLCPSASQILPTPLHQEVTFSCYTARVPKVTPSKKS